MIHMTMVNEGVDRGQRLNFFPGIRIRCGLKLFAIRREQRVETLLAEDDAAGLSIQ